MARRGSHGTSRQYPRTARLNELLREILADELERSDDDRLEMVTVTAVEIEGDLRHAVVFFDTLEGEDGDDAVLEALGEVRWRLQGAIGRQARMKRTPELSFRPDPAVREGARIESLLAAGDRPVTTETSATSETDEPAS
ncbi:MAG: 30S ribosome-binding factor RbfA [Actinobacteria bacterium]|nr:30S ribosome-binding factor RbfA [Actinomycetota bacterium]